MVFFKVRNDWQRQTILANGFRLWAEDIYEHEFGENGIGEYIARTTAQGGIQ